MQQSRSRAPSSVYPWLIIGIVAGVAYAIPIIGMLIAEIVAVPRAFRRASSWSSPCKSSCSAWRASAINVLVLKIMGECRRLPDWRDVCVLRGRRVVRHPRVDSRHPAAALIKIVWRYFVAHRGCTRSSKRPPCVTPERSE